MMKFLNSQMKKLIGWPVATLLFLIGDLVCRLAHRFDIGLLYRPYNSLMIWSMDVNDWANLNVWEKVE